MRRPLKNRVGLAIALAALVFAATHNIRAELPQAVGTWASLRRARELDDSREWISTFPVSVRMGFEKNIVLHLG